MFEKNMSIAQVVGLLNKVGANKSLFVYSDKKWAYPEQGDNQKSCTMLDMNFNIEKRPGIVIHIPDLTLEELNESLPRRKLGKNAVAEG